MDLRAIAKITDELLDWRSPSDKVLIAVCKECGAQISNELCTYDCSMEQRSMHERRGHLHMIVAEKIVRVVEEYDA